MICKIEIMKTGSFHDWFKEQNDKKIDRHSPLIFNKRLHCERIVVNRDRRISEPELLIQNFGGFLA